ncbi:MAG: hypothetical protein KKD24_09065, partial [Proteobacteria bacterium]|nr:hypothetical protein [Pseudomonadota bacterium]
MTRSDHRQDRIRAKAPALAPCLIIGKSLRIENGRQEAPCSRDCFAVFERASPKLSGSPGEG